MQEEGWRGGGRRLTPTGSLETDEGILGCLDEELRGPREVGVVRGHPAGRAGRTMSGGVERETGYGSKRGVEKARSQGWVRSGCQPGTSNLTVANEGGEEGGGRPETTDGAQAGQRSPAQTE